MDQARLYELYDRDPAPIVEFLEYLRELYELPRPGTGGRFRQAGFLELDDVATFDLVAAVNGPYSYLLTPWERRTALERCAQARRPSGVLFLEFASVHWILRNYREPAELSGARILVAAQIPSFARDAA